EIKGERILQRFDSLANANIADFIRIAEDGTHSVNLSGKSREELYGIQGLTTETYLVGKGDNKQPVTVVKVKLVDRQKALDSLARHKRLYNDTPQVAVQVNYASMSDAELERRVAELLAAQREGGEVVDAQLVGEKLLPSGESERASE